MTVPMCSIGGNQAEFHELGNEHVVWIDCPHGYQAAHVQQGQSRPKNGIRACRNRIHIDWYRCKWVGRRRRQ